jgi:hypothetical protein
MYLPRITHENTISLIPKNPYTVADSLFRENAIVPDDIYTMSATWQHVICCPTKHEPCNIHYIHLTEEA